MKTIKHYLHNHNNPLRSIVIFVGSFERQVRVDKWDFNPGTQNKSTELMSFKSSFQAFESMTECVFLVFAQREQHLQ